MRVVPGGVNDIGHRHRAGSDPGWAGVDRVGGIDSVGAHIPVPTPDWGGAMTNQKEKPVLFQGDIVQAVLNDTKTQDRQVIKPQPLFYMGRYWMWHNGEKRVGRNGQPFSAFCAKLAEYGRYRVGDRLWVREVWGLLDADETLLEQEGITHGQTDGALMKPLYMADGESSLVRHWRHSIHMPRWASRISLEVTAVTVQRINSISLLDVTKEGIRAVQEGYGLADENATYQKFKVLWDSINAIPKPVKVVGKGLGGGKKQLSHYASYPWDGEYQVLMYRDKPHLIYGNPFVFVYEFKRLFPEPVEAVAVEHGN